MENHEIFASIGVALSIGFLIGSEREQDADSQQSHLGGIRTYPLVALCGAMGAILGSQHGMVILPMMFVGVMSFAAIAYWHRFEQGFAGMTSEVSLILTFALGALAVSDGVIPELGPRLILVASLAVVVAAFLSAKKMLHRIIDRASKEDVLATLKFLIVAVIILPLLPDQTYGPLNVLNPFNIGLMAVFIAGIGFAGYVAVRVFGSGRGMVLTGLIGGLVSSTAVMLSFSGRAKSEPKVALTAAVAVCAASTIMFPRILIEVAVVNESLLDKLLIPLSAMFLVCAAASAILYRKTQRTKGGETSEAVDVHNPFDLSEAIKFAALYAGVLFISKGATEYLGSSGTYLAGILAGTTDVDAITLSMAHQVKEGLSPSVGATTIMLGAGANTIVKAGLAVTLGGWAFARHVVIVFSATLLAGALGIVWMWLY